MPSRAQPTLSRESPRPVGLSSPPASAGDSRLLRPGWSYGGQPQRAHPLEIASSEPTSAAPPTLVACRLPSPPFPQFTTVSRRLTTYPGGSQSTLAFRQRPPEAYLLCTSCHTVARPCNSPPRGPSSATGSRAGCASAHPWHPSSPWARALAEGRVSSECVLPLPAGLWAAMRFLYPQPLFTDAGRAHRLRAHPPPASFLRSPPSVLFHTVVAHLLP